MPVETATLDESGLFTVAGGFDESSAPEFNDRNGRIGVVRVTGFSAPDLSVEGDSGATPSPRFSSVTLSVGYSSFAADNLPCTLYVHAVRVAPSPSWTTRNPTSWVTQVGLEHVLGELNRNVLLEVARLVLTAVPDDPITFDADIGVLNTLGGQPGFDGSLSFQLNAQLPSGASGIVLDDNGGDNPFTLSATTDLRPTTGISTNRTDWLGRTDICPVCGFTSLRDDWVVDPLRRFRVCPKCSDPDDERPIILTRGEKPPAFED